MNPATKVLDCSISPGLAIEITTPIRGSPGGVGHKLPLSLRQCARPCNIPCRSCNNLLLHTAFTSGALYTMTPRGGAMGDASPPLSREDEVRGQSTHARKQRESLPRNELCAISRFFLNVGPLSNEANPSFEPICFQRASSISPASSPSMLRKS